MTRKVYSPVFGLNRRTENLNKSEYLVRKFLKIFIIVLGIVFLLESLFHFILSPQLKIQRIEVIGYSGNPQEILALSGIGELSYFFSISEKHIEENLLSSAYVRTAKVVKQFPDGLTIEVEMRVPVAMIVSNEDAKTYLVDAVGVIFPKKVSASTDYPLITGFDWNSEEGRPILAGHYLDFLDDLGKLKEQNPEIFGLISEITVNSHAQSGFFLAIYFVHSPVKILLGHRINIASLQQALLFLDLIRREAWETKVTELDMREGNAVFRERSGT